jgi:hypothetical protein
MSALKTEGEGPTREQASLLRMVYGAQAAQVVYVAAKLALADLLASWDAGQFRTSEGSKHRRTYLTTSTPGCG